MASRVASGIVPAVVLPYLPMFDHDLLHRQAQPLRGRVDDAAIGLMRNQQIQIGGVRPLRSSSARHTSCIFRTAYLKTCAPS